LATDGKPDPAAQVSAGCHLRSAHRFGGRGHRVLADCWSPPASGHARRDGAGVRGDAASRDTYRIARVYLDWRDGT